MPKTDPIRCALSALLLLPVSVVTVRADSGDALNYSLRHGITCEDNLFRLPDGMFPATGGGERSDTQTATSVNAAFDRTYGIQRLAANVGLSALRYRRNTQLDSDSLNGLAAWYWRSGNRLDGELSLGRSEAQTSFAELGLPVRNLSRATTATLAGNWWFHSNWSAGLRQVETRRDNSSASQAANDSESRTMEANLRFRPASGNTVTFRHARTDARYPTPAATASGAVRNDFELEESGLNATYRASGASEFAAGFSRVSKRHKEASDRDFTGATGRVEWSWSPVGKMSYRLAAARSIGAQDDALSRSTVSDTFSGAAQWAATARIGVSATVSEGRNKARGDGAGSDRVRSAGLSASYSPWQQFLVAANWQGEERAADDARRDFRAQRLSLNVSWSF